MGESILGILGTLAHFRHFLFCSFHFSKKFSGSLQNGKGCREQDTVLAQPAGLPRVEMQDKDDLPSLGAAIAAGVVVLVTGDQELLDLGHIEDLEILSPRQFWKKLRVQPIRTETT